MPGQGIFNPTYAVEIEGISASESAGRYTVELRMIADIPEEFAREILEDPNRTVKVNAELVAVHDLPSKQPGVRRLRDHTRACVLFFCVEYQNTLSMRVLGNSDIQLTVEPALSEFKYGVFTWHTESIDEKRTRLVFTSVSEPGFWVPSVALLKYRMKWGVREMVRRMECEYRQDDICIDSDWVDSTLGSE